MFLRFAGFKPGRRARRRPADLRDAGPARHRVGVPRRAAGHHARGHGRGPDGAGRPGAARARRPDQRSTARSPSGCPARTPACSPPSATDTVVDGEEVDLGLVGEVAEVRPEAVLDLDRRRPDPGRLQRRPRRRTGQVHNVNADTAAAALAVALGAEKLLVLTDVEGLYRDWPDSDDVIYEISPEALARADAEPGQRAWCPRWGPASRPSQGGVPRATSSTAASRTPCCSRSSPTRASAPRCCPASTDQDPQGHADDASDRTTTWQDARTPAR